MLHPAMLEPYSTLAGLPEDQELGEGHKMQWNPKTWLYHLWVMEP